MRPPFLYVLNSSVVQFAPVSGTVEEINETLNDQPGLLNKSPEEKGMFHTSAPGLQANDLRKTGWLCKIKLSDPSEVSSHSLQYHGYGVNNPRCCSSRSC